MKSRTLVPFEYSIASGDPEDPQGHHSGGCRTARRVRQPPLHPRRARLLRVSHGQAGQSRGTEVRGGAGVGFGRAGGGVRGAGARPASGGASAHLTKLLNHASASSSDVKSLVGAFVLLRPKNKLPITRLIGESTRI